MQCKHACSPRITASLSFRDALYVCGQLVCLIDFSSRLSMFRWTDLNSAAMARTILQQIRNTTTHITEHRQEKRKGDRASKQMSM